MHDLPLGWATDLAVLRHSGSLVSDHGDHLVVRTPRNPDFHWGNCVFVLDERTVDDAERWLGVFDAAHPGAGWVSVGLVREPDDATAWTAQGVAIEADDVLASGQPPTLTPLADGYTVRRIDGDDWEQVVAAEIADNELTGEYEPALHERFARAQTALRRGLSERDVAAFFGAFADGVLASSLGIVVCGETARYQSVGTDAGHRRRGLAAHLLGVAATWSAGKGCDRWVIITEAGNPAGRLYRSVGFAPDVSNARAYRAPVGEQ
ncbi:MAG TPA: GNAT family N-acetyltransferase [Propionicimonas sp.]